MSIVDRKQLNKFIGVDPKFLLSFFVVSKVCFCVRFAIHYILFNYVVALVLICLPLPNAFVSLVICCFCRRRRFDVVFVRTHSG